MNRTLEMVWAGNHAAVQGTIQIKQNSRHVAGKSKALKKDALNDGVFFFFAALNVHESKIRFLAFTE